MKKIINKPADFVSEMLDGLLKAHPDQLAYEEELQCIVRADAPVEGKVALATGGGSGHLPVFLGYVGKGLLDGCAVGDVFNSPSADQMLDGHQAHPWRQRRRLHLRQLQRRRDELRHGQRDGRHGRHRGAHGAGARRRRLGSAGSRRTDGAAWPAWSSPSRCAGAKADMGGSLDEVAAAAEKALANTRSMGVALSPCTVPMAGTPTFTIGDDEMEIGMGIHGEPGVKREKLQTADRDHRAHHDRHSRRHAA